MTIGTIKNKVLANSGSSEVTTIKVSASTWESIFSVIGASKKFRELFSFFGLSEVDFIPRVLSDVLLSDKKKLSREVFVSYDKNGHILGLVLKLGLPPLTNVTSLIENAYIIPSGHNNSAFISAIFSNDNELLMGVEDICFLNSALEDDLNIKKAVDEFVPREFRTGDWKTCTSSRRQYKMKKILKKKNVFIVIAFAIPLLVASTRELVIGSLSGYLNLVKLRPTAVSNRECVNDLCRTRYSFSIEPNLFEKYSNLTVGTYGAELDSYLNVNGFDVDPLIVKGDLRPTWMKFKNWQIASNKTEPVTRLDLVWRVPRRHPKEWFIKWL